MHFDYRWGVFSMNSTRGSCDQTSSFWNDINSEIKIELDIHHLFVVNAWLCRHDVCSTVQIIYATRTLHSPKLQQTVAHPVQALIDF